MLAAADIAAARALCAQTGQPLLDALEGQCHLAGTELVDALGSLLGLRTAALESLPVERAAFDALPFAEASERRCVPVRFATGLAVVHADPFHGSVRAWAEERIAEPFEWWLAHPSAIDAFFRRFEESARALDEVARDAREGREELARSGEVLSLQTIGEGESLAVRLVSSTVYDALKCGASDVHLETEPGGLVVKYRVD